MDVHKKKRLDFVAGSLLTMVLRPLAYLLGVILQRDHAVQGTRDITVLKLLGGGSLIIALPALLGIRQRYPRVHMRLITTRAVLPFGELVGVFDEIITIDDSRFFKLAVSSIRALASCWRADTMLDLEVYSRLTSVFMLLACARNRVGFYTESTFWRIGLTTHLIFFNRSSGVFVFYDQMARFLGAEPATNDAARAHLRAKISNQDDKGRCGRRFIGIGHGCSGLSPERKLTVKEWTNVIVQKLKGAPLHDVDVEFYGVGAERAEADSIIAAMQKQIPTSSFRNRCGELALAQSVACLASADEFLTIDSGLMHIARALGVPSTSFWGPTDPSVLLRPMPELRESVRYNRVACSPCVHVADRAPCLGDNVCIHSLFESSTSVRRDLMWLVQS